MPQRVQVKVLNGKYIPCDKCKIRLKCPMYATFTKKRIRGTNRIQYCDIWEPS
jgi:hypothetical protein